MHPTLAFTLVLSILLPSVYPNPESQGTCTVSEDDLNSIKSALKKATSGRESDEDILSAEILQQCPMLKNITEQIQSAANEIRNLKENSIAIEEVEQLRESFEQKVNDITKSQDIFEKQSNLESTKEQGEMIERMTALQVRVTELQKEIAAKTKQMYEDMAELIFESLRMNKTDRIQNYTKRMMDERLDKLMDKLETDYEVYLGALRFLNQLNNLTLIDKVFDAILDRLSQMTPNDDTVRENGKNLLVNLLCWTVNNDFLTEKYRKKQYELFRVALKFYPQTGEKAANEADVRSRQYCKANFPTNVVTWFAVSAKESGKI